MCDVTCPISIQEVPIQRNSALWTELVLRPYRKGIVPFRPLSFPEIVSFGTQTFKNYKLDPFHFHQLTI